MIIEKKNYDAINYKLDCNDLKEEKFDDKNKKEKISKSPKKIFMEFYFVVAGNFGTNFFF
jgi:hypothetical protein